MNLTARQYIALHLYYAEGWSITRISGMLSCTKQAVHSLMGRAKTRIVETYTTNDVDLAIHMRDILRPCPAASITHSKGKAASRRELLLDALEQRMLQRATELANIRECMSGKSFLPTHLATNRYDQWESRYLNECGVVIDPIRDEDLPDGWHMEPRRNPRVPDSAYKSKNAAAYCASDPSTCGITDRCVGCRG